MECTLYVTDDCNLCCRYCYEGNRKNSSYMGRETLEQALDFMIENSLGDDTVDLVLLGGEPLMNKKMIYELFELIRTKYPDMKERFRCSITTNGIFLDQKSIDFLTGHKVKISISADGDRETHNLNRKSPDGTDSYSVIERNISRLLEQNIEFSVRMTVVPNNVHRLHRNLEYFWRLGVRKIHVGLDYLANWEESSLVMLDRQMELADQFYLNKILPDKKAILNIYDYKLSTFVFQREASYCSAGSRNHVVINSKGQIYPCGYVANDTEWEIGSVFTSLDRKKFITKARSHVMPEPSCRECELAFTCSGAKCGFLNYRKTGYLNLNAQVICKLEKTLFYHNKKVFEKLYEKKSPRLMKLIDTAAEHHIALGAQMTEIMNQAEEKERTYV